MIESGSRSKVIKCGVVVFDDESLSVSVIYLHRRHSQTVIMPAKYDRVQYDLFYVDIIISLSFT